MKKQLIIQLKFGKKSQEFKELKENLDSILSFVTNALPNGNNNINSIYIKTTMGKAVRVEDTGKGRR
jgi:large subunit ribosomal protein L1